MMEEVEVWIGGAVRQADRQARRGHTSSTHGSRNMTRARGAPRPASWMISFTMPLMYPVQREAVRKTAIRSRATAGNQAGHAQERAPSGQERSSTPAGFRFKRSRVHPGRVDDQRVTRRLTIDKRMPHLCVSWDVHAHGGGSGRVVWMGGRVDDQGTGERARRWAGQWEGGSGRVASTHRASRHSRGSGTWRHPCGASSAT